MRLLLIAALLLSGCVTNPIDDVATPEAEKHEIRFDQRLLTKCGNFEEKLVTGEDAEVVKWSEKALKNASDCRKAQHTLVDEVKKMLRIK